MNFIVLILTFIFLFPVFGQEGEKDFTYSDESDQRVEVLPPNEDPYPSLEEPLQETGEEEPSETRPHETSVQIPRADENPNDELQKLDHASQDAGPLGDLQAVETISPSFALARLRSLPDAEVAKLILDQAGNSFLGDFLKAQPKIVSFFVDVLKDERALPAALGIFRRNDDLRIYLLIWFCLLMLTWFMKKYWIERQTNWGSFQRFFAGIGVGLVTFVISLTIFYHMFYEELSPLFRIFLKQWS